MKHTSSSRAVVVELPFKPPFDWHKMLQFFDGRSSAGVEAVEDGVYRRAIEWGEDDGTMEVRLHSKRKCLVATIDGSVARHADDLIEPMSRMFDTKTNPKDIYKCFSADPWLAPLVELSPGLRVPGAWSAFELVVRTIVGQQVSVKAATTVMGRIVQRAGKRIEDHPHEGTAWRFPTPAALAAADLSGIGMPGKRVATVQTVAAAVASGALPLDNREANSAMIRTSLLELPGIGPWTVEYVAMRALRDPDAWPASDLVLMNAITKRDPALTRPGQQKARSEVWRPWRAYAAIHLWNGFAMESGRAGGG
ncbi:DNA-3-methyladenine glycosylase 2 family protein [Paraburkholderia bengalensis]|uniref:DNA-3-methyladenine glycosylase II n=1 Tax=Paraburkholderia bengalensis TaxID=2747562 RepID=A0ABU8ILE9_9BURK